MAIFRKFHHLYFLIPIVAYGLLYMVLSQTSLNINHDVTIFLEIGHRILNGQQPYVDFYEINFPMMQYLAVIPAIIVRWTGANVIEVTHIATWVLVGWSSVSSYILTRRLTQDQHLPYIIPTIIIVYSTALQIPFDDVSQFAQREHIFILLFLPFALIRMQQWHVETSERGVLWRFVYGFLAAIGIAIKPYFVVIPVAMELYGLSQHRDWRRLLRAEILGVVAVATIHLAYFLVFPDVFDGFLKMVSLSPRYITFFDRNDPNPFLNFLVLEDLRTTVFVFMIFGLIQFVSEVEARLIHTLRILMLAGAFSFSMQRGFTYHAIPYQIVMWILILYVVARYLHPPHYDETKSYDLIRNPLMYLIVITLLYFFMIYLNINVPDHTAFKTRSNYQAFLMEHTEEGEGIFVISDSFFYKPNLNFPALYQIGRWNMSPYFNHFPFNWGWERPLELEEKLTTEPLPIVGEWQEQIGTAIQENQPHLIIIHPNIERYLAQVGFMDRYIHGDYTVIESDNGFIAYELRNS